MTLLITTHFIALIIMILSVLGINRNDDFITVNLGKIVEYNISDLNEIIIISTNKNDVFYIPTKLIIDYQSIEDGKILYKFQYDNGILLYYMKEE